MRLIGAIHDLDAVNLRIVKQVSDLKTSYFEFDQNLTLISIVQF